MLFLILIFALHGGSIHAFLLWSYSMICIKTVSDRSDLRNRLKIKSLRLVSDIHPDRSHRFLVPSISDSYRRRFISKSVAPRRFYSSQA